jgi:hypothetical protein
MMKAARTSETSINFHQTARINTPEDSHLPTHSLENLKSHYGVVFLRCAAFIKNVLGYSNYKYLT